MACGKNDVLYTVVLMCDTRNRSEWPLVGREVRLRWCSLVYQQGCTLCGTSSLSVHMLVCFVVYATGVAVTWM
jgi:hypothetical protein